MKKVICTTLAIAFACLPLLAQRRDITDDDRGFVSVSNDSKHAIWVTLYGQSGRGNNAARGCAEPGKTVILRNSAFGKSIRKYWVLAEVKASATSCADHSNIYTKDMGPYTWHTTRISMPGPNSVTWTSQF